MEVKKSPKADLEGKKSTWLLIGYVFILALMFVAFEWTEYNNQSSTSTFFYIGAEEAYSAGTSTVASTTDSIIWFE